jgi:hypothetical protein
MNSKNFASFLGKTVKEKLSAWEGNILNGLFKSPEEYQRAVGVSQALNSVIDSIPQLHDTFIQQADDAINASLSVPLMQDSAVIPTPTANQNTSNPSPEAA